MKRKVKLLHLVGQREDLLLHPLHRLQLLRQLLYRLLLLDQRLLLPLGQRLQQRVVLARGLKLGLRLLPQLRLLLQSSTARKIRWDE